MASCIEESDGAAVRKSGIIFVEARIRDDVDLGLNEAERIRDSLEDLLSVPSQTFDLGEDILANQYRALLILGHSHEAVKRKVHSLKIADYSGPKLGAVCHTSDDAKIKVQAYKLYKTTEERESLHQAEIIPLPHIKFDRQWDELVFEEDIKGELIRLMENMLRFSQNSEKRPDFNPLVLLHGSPGTGKTTLCQGLAQKISIRLNRTYKRTKFIQIKTATLLSKFYSQSAKQVDEIFTAIGEICEEDPNQFICILIDEVECIASSRESSMHGEVQDSLRATNALLTGLDRTKDHVNIIILCTSNMPSCLDSAFLDRCGIKLAVDLPRPVVQYEILRGRLQSLIDNGHIMSRASLPPYRDARLELDTDDSLPGSKLLGIVALINTVNSSSPERISGRTLSQLPGKAVLRYLDNADCDLETAFRFMKRNILAENVQGIQKRGSEVKGSSQVQRESTDDPGQNEKTTMITSNDWDVDRVLAVLGAIESLVDAVFPGWKALKRQRDQNSDA